MTLDYEQMTDADLSEAVAVRCAGWKAEKALGYGNGWRVNFGGNIYSGMVYSCPRVAIRNEATFATSANAVLPILHAHRWWASDKPCRTTADISISIGLQYMVKSTAPTFARAACIALLRAKDAENLTKTA